MSNPPSLRDRALIPLVILLVGVRVLSATTSSLINADAYYYLDSAAMLRAGAWREALTTWSLHPLYSVVIALVEGVARNPWVAGVIVSVLAAAGALVALYGLALEGWGRWAARFAAFLYALSPSYAEIEGKVLSEGLYHLLAFWTVLCLWRGLRYRSWRWQAAAGACLAGAYLTRAEGALLAGELLVAGCILMVFGREFRFGWRGALTCGLLLALIAAPYALWLHSEYGGWTLSPRKSVGMVASGTPVRKTGDDLPMATGERPATTFAAVGGVAHQAHRMYYPTCLCLAALGLLCFRRGASGGWTGALLAMLSFGHLVAMVIYANLTSSHVSLRYVSFGTAMLLPWAGWGFYRTTLWLRTTKHGVAVATALVLAVAVSLLPHSLEFKGRGEKDLLAAARWLRDNGGAGRPLIASTDSLAYHAGGRLVRARRPKAILAVVSTGTAEFMVFEDKEFAEMDAGYRARILGSPGVRLLKRFGEEGAGVAVYALKGSP